MFAMFFKFQCFGMYAKVRIQRRPATTIVQSDVTKTFLDVNIPRYKENSYSSKAKV